MQTRSFPSEIFARLAPDVFFERHIEVRERPTSRKFLETRPVDVKQGDPLSLKSALGSAVVRAGGATVVCGITGGLTRFKGEGGVYANVEIHRGGASGNPSGEEQVLSMSVHRLIQAAKFDQATFFVDDEYEICLNAQIVILSRTGPMLDLVWTSLVAALQAVKVPEFVQDEITLELKPSENTHPLALPKGLADVHRTYGIYDGQVIADIDGAVEEECIIDRFSFAKSQATNTFSGFSLAAPNGCDISTIANILGSD